MNLTFIEFIPFIRFRDEHLTDEEYRTLQNALLENPEKGDLIPGLGGLRKIRIANAQQNKGKRGGARAIYFYYIGKDRIYFLAGYTKNRQIDLNSEQKKILRNVIDLIKSENEI